MYSSKPQRRGFILPPPAAAPALDWAAFLGYPGSMKPLLVLSLSMLALIPLYGQGELTASSPSSYTVSLDLALGVKYGQVEEIVYKSPESDIKLSELLWDLKPLVYWGVVVDYSRRNPLEAKGFFIHTSLQAAFPGKTGVMEDRDWLGPGDALSNFSSHTNYIDGAWFLDLSAGLSLPLFSRFWIQFYGAFNYMNFHWTSREGYKQYAELKDEYEPWSPDIPREPFFGPGIFYSQDWLIFSPGLSLHLPFFRYFHAALYFQITPLIIGVARDDHWQRKLQFTDSIFFGLFMEPKGELVISPNERFDISLEFSYRFIKGPRGNTRTKKTSTGETEEANNSGGASYYVLDGGLSVTVHF
jgi:outer membrane protease